MRVRDPADVDAWEQFLYVYTPIIRTYCRQRRIQEADVEDIVQDVFSRVANAIRDFGYDAQRGRFRAWLGTVAANRIKSFLAKEWRRVDDGQDELATSQVTADPDSEWVEIFSERIFGIACARVREKFTLVAWTSFESTWVHKKQASDVARELGISTHAVYVNKSRVLKSLEAEVRVLVDDVPFPDAIS